MPPFRIQAWQRIAILRVELPRACAAFGLDIVAAVAVSLFVMIHTAAISAATARLEETLHLEYAIPLILGIVGIVIGAQIGPRIGARVPKVRLRQLFGLVLLYAAVNMVLKGVQGIA